MRGHVIGNAPNIFIDTRSREQRFLLARKARKRKAAFSSWLSKYHSKIKDGKSKS